VPPPKAPDKKPPEKTVAPQKPTTSNQDIVATPDATRDPKKKPGTGKKKPDVPAGVPVTRPDGVEPLKTPEPMTPEDVRTPITHKPLETSIDDEKKTP
jgi:hypothetical protein